ncbi:DUF6207 family protein [Streptomyces sp. MBT33]|uniref:DUF6207 family protein n=1 Tax=Streptomyces sp. MBT33 TaxID=1488363 RepID=UPI001F31EB42|nr:DUF6207 family protein [Streptomyces sp. MBT33]
MIQDGYRDLRVGRRCHWQRPGRVNPRSAQNLRRAEHVLTDVDPIREAHLSEPGLLVIDVAGFDDETVFAFQAAIARIWGTSPAERSTRDVGQPGVRLRMYADLRQALDEASPQERAPSTGTE